MPTIENLRKQLQERLATRKGSRASSAEVSISAESSVALRSAAELCKRAIEGASDKVAKALCKVRDTFSGIAPVGDDGIEPEDARAEIGKILSQVLPELEEGSDARSVAVEAMSAIESSVPVEKASWGDTYTKGLPDQAFAVLRTEKDADGNVKVTSRAVPHHKRGVSDGMDHTTVDKERLVWCMEHLNVFKLEPSEFVRAMKHLRYHAKAMGLVQKDSETDSGKGTVAAVSKGDSRVEVRKLTLVGDENLYTFRENLDRAWFEWLRGQSDKAIIEMFGPPNENEAMRDVYVSRIFKDTIIVNMGYKRFGGIDGSGMYRGTWSRDGKGEFSFGDKFVPVKLVESYVPAESELAKSDVRKATWTAKFTNALPDAAFALIRDGGQLDDDDKTTPRSLRFLPHHNADVKDPDDDKTVDLPHLRDALSRVEQASLTEDEKKQAKAHLEAHAKRIGVGEAAEEGKENTEKSFEVKCVASRVEKAEDGTEQRIVIGVVLEPNDGKDAPKRPDTQNDIYSAKTIENAAHGWALKGFHFKVSHAQPGDARLVCIESYIAPQDLKYDGAKETIIKGSWVMAAKVVDDALWEKVKAEGFTGWSVGGTAVRTPEEGNDND